LEFRARVRAGHLEPAHDGRPLNPVEGVQGGDAGPRVGACFQSLLPATEGPTCCVCNENLLRGSAPSRTRMAAPRLARSISVPDEPYPARSRGFLVPDARSRSRRPGSATCRETRPIRLSIVFRRGRDGGRWAEPRSTTSDSVNSIAKLRRRGPFGHYAMQDGIGLGRQVRSLRLQCRTRLGVERVELAVLRELRMERHEPAAAVQPRRGKSGAKVGGTRAGRHAHEVHLAVEVGHEKALGTVRNLTQVVDPGTASAASRSAPESVPTSETR
jgi:hypothetical protein